MVGCNSSPSKKLEEKARIPKFCPAEFDNPANVA
jgi:hypothetical protein